MRTEYKVRYEVHGRRVGFYPVLFDTPIEIMTETVKGKSVRYQEVFRPRCFNGFLKGKADVAVTIGQDRKRVIARRSDNTLAIQADPYGLFCSVYMPEGWLCDHILSEATTNKLWTVAVDFEPVWNNFTGKGVERLGVKLKGICLHADMTKLDELKAINERLKRGVCRSKNKNVPSRRPQLAR